MKMKKNMMLEMGQREPAVVFACARGRGRVVRVEMEMGVEMEMVIGIEMGIVFEIEIWDCVLCVVCCVLTAPPTSPQPSPPTKRDQPSPNGASSPRSARPVGVYGRLDWGCCCCCGP